MNDLEPTFWMFRGMLRTRLGDQLGAHLADGLYRQNHIIIGQGDDNFARQLRHVIWLMTQEEFDSTILAHLREEFG